MSYICTNCGKETPTSTFHNACECGGLFSLPQDHLPLWQESLIDKSVWSQFRYHAFMNLGGDVWRRVSMGEGMTPIVSYNGSVFLKMDFMMPTLSFKDRGAATLVSHMKAIGVKKCVPGLQRQRRRGCCRLLRQKRCRLRNLRSRRHQPE